MRLDRLLSNMGYGSRKDVKSMIKKKKITVNGKKVTSSNLQVEPDADVAEIGNATVKYQRYVYLMLHKPSGYVSATEDTTEKTVIDLLPSQYRHFTPHPVGRLDKDTEGLLLLTNDGDLTHNLLSPKKDVEKVYYAKIDGEVTGHDVSAFKSGIKLDDGYVAKPAKLEILNSGNCSEVEIAVTEGKYHQVKRMFRAVGKRVIYLKRLKMGKLLLDQNLPRGEVRELTEDELDYCLSLKEKS